MSDDVFTVDGYQLPNCLANGNSSEIWEVADPVGGSQALCMKLLLPEAFEKSEAKAVLKHEAKVAKTLDHPNIIKIHKVAVTKKHAYILMDYFRARNLKTQIGSDPVGLQVRFRNVFESLCLALGFMHEKGWVHRDIKPENILANKVGEMRLIDFSLSVRSAGGLGKLMGARKKPVQGTRTYIAPETLLKKAPTFQTDMYSLGITVFEILTGNPPFRGMSPSDLLRMHIQDKAPPISAINENVTPEMDRLVARLLEKKPVNRHKSMEEVYSEFRSLKVFKEDPKVIDEAQKKSARKRSWIRWVPGTESTAAATICVRKRDWPRPPNPKPRCRPNPKSRSLRRKLHRNISRRSRHIPWRGRGMVRRECHRRCPTRTIRSSRRADMDFLRGCSRHPVIRCRNKPRRDFHRDTVTHRRECRSPIRKRLILRKDRPLRNRRSKPRSPHPIRNPRRLPSLRNPIPRPPPRSHPKRLPNPQRKKRKKTCP